MLCDFNFKMPIYAPFGEFLWGKTGEMHTFPVLALYECNNLGPTS